MATIEDFNHIKDVLEALDTLRPSRFGYTPAVLSATGESEISALTGVYITDDTTKINSIPTPDLVEVDDQIISTGLRSESSSLARMAVNHFFGRLGLNLIKTTEKVRQLVEDHLVNRYITPSGKVLEVLTLTHESDDIKIIQHQSRLDASAPVTASAAVTLLAAVYNGNAGVMTGADKKKLDDVDSAAVKTSGDQTVNGIKTFGSIPVLPASDPSTDNQAVRKAYVDTFAASVVSMDDRIDASQQQNLVYNYDFRYFSNQLATIASWYSYKHPDGWVFTDSGTDGKIGYNTSSEC